MSENPDDFVFVQPRQRREGKKKRRKKSRPWPPSEITRTDSVEDFSWRENGVYNQIRKTHDIISEQPVRDDELAYYLIETVAKINHPNSLQVLEKLKARVLCYIDPSQNRVLVEAPLKKLKEIADERRLKYIEQNIHMMRPLRTYEKVATKIVDADWVNQNRGIVVEIVPNVISNKMAGYLEKVSEYLRQIGLKTKESPSDELLKRNGLILSIASIEQSKKMADECNLIYRVFRTPKLKKSTLSISLPKSVTISNVEIQNLPKVCVIDTGICGIPQINPLIEGSSYEDIFTDPIDQDNHGTSVACLVAFGEGNQTASPSFRVLSHKVFSPSRGIGDLFNGLINAISLYGNQTKVFVSSCIFEHNTFEERQVTALLDAFCQEQNVCVVFCSGNILPPYDHKNYPTYIALHNVSHPSDALSFTSVGSLVKHTNPHTFAPVNGPSPFSRLGCFENLPSPIKPEVVQHGGNCYENGDDTGVGVKTFSSNGGQIEICGTSFSAPLFARVMAHIYDHYGDKFNNNETARAMAYSSCHQYLPLFSKYLGFGESSFDRAVHSSWNDARLVFEGELPLGFMHDGRDYDAYDEVRFNLPSGVSDVSLTIVHTDNYSKYLEKPQLHTNVAVKTWKAGSERPVIPRKVSPSFIAHARKMLWQYSRGTVGPWKFEIRPKSVDIPKKERSEVTIRYGAVIEIKARRGKIRPLTERLKDANRSIMT